MRSATVSLTAPVRPSRRITPRRAPASAAAPSTHGRATRVAALVLVLVMVGTLAAGLLGATRSDPTDPAPATPAAATGDDVLDLSQLSDEELASLLQSQGVAVDPATGQLVADPAVDPAVDPAAGATGTAPAPPATDPVAAPAG